MKGYIPNMVSKIAAMIVAIPVSVVILVGLWVYKKTSSRGKEEE